MPQLWLRPATRDTPYADMQLERATEDLLVN